MTKNVKKLSQEEFSKILDEFVIKSISIIVQSRVSANNLNEEKIKNNNVKF